MHSHAGGPGPAARRPRALGLVLAITLGVVVLETAGGLLSGSLALLSDAGHALADSFALALALAAQRFACRPATPSRSFGFLRLEILAALLNGAALGIVAFFLFREAVARFFAPQPVQTGLLLGVAAVGLLANLLGAYLLHGAGDDLNHRSAYAHVVSDALSSVGVLVGAGLMRLTGDTRFDALTGSVIAIVILWSAVRIAREAVDVLLEASPKGIHSVDVAEAMRAVGGVLSIHDLHIWSLTTGVEALSAHVQVSPADLPHTDRILTELNSLLLTRYRIRHTTLQIESQTEAHVCPVGE